MTGRRSGQPRHMAKPQFQADSNLDLGYPAEQGYQVMYSPPQFFTRQLQASVDKCLRRDEKGVEQFCDAKEVI